MDKSKRQFVNTSGWEKAEIKMLETLVRSEGTDRSKLIRRLVRDAAKSTNGTKAENVSGLS